MIPIFEPRQARFLFVLLLLLSPLAFADPYAQGMKALKVYDFKQAKTDFLMGAEQLDPRSMQELLKMFENNQEVTREDFTSEIRVLYRRAAEESVRVYEGAGHGGISRAGGSPALQRGVSGEASQGAPLAMNNLGLVHLHGLGGPKNNVAARHEFARAVSLGSSDAWVNQGQMEEFGHGCKVNPEQAALLYAKAADLNHRGGRLTAGRNPGCSTAW